MADDHDAAEDAELTEKLTEKERAAARAVEFVRDGMTLGLGSGSTANIAVRLLGELVRQKGWHVRGVPTSFLTAALAAEVGLPLIELNDVARVDLTIDGADEIGPGLALIKGGGGALLREKIVAAASDTVIIIADSSKLVAQLGAFPLPVEVVPFARAFVERRLSALELNPKLRLTRDGAVYRTDQDNEILDCHAGAIPDPEGLGRELAAIPGIVEHGLFLGLAHRAIVATGPDVRELLP
ncbi:MAG: ribose-5-phosphate isomerase RpiA [Bryobacteraceae bacterium]|nr:ribose-5-phosphate isomerase RpiA [Bryobacteraceae bacterium]